MVLLLYPTSPVPHRHVGTVLPIYISAQTRMWVGVHTPSAGYNGSSDRFILSPPLKVLLEQRENIILTSRTEKNTSALIVNTPLLRRAVGMDSRAAHVPCLFSRGFTAAVLVPSIYIHKMGQGCCSLILPRPCCLGLPVYMSRKERWFVFCLLFIPVPTPCHTAVYPRKQVTYIQSTRI